MTVAVAVVGGGWPKTKPLAAAATAVPVPTSCDKRVAKAVSDQVDNKKKS